MILHLPGLYGETAEGEAGGMGGDKESVPIFKQPPW